MGYYINPIECSKEQWLANHGVLSLEPPPITETHLPVCLVNNGAFTAAGVGINQDEVEAFTQLSDHRPKKWYSVSRAKLLEVGAI